MRPGGKVVRHMAALKTQLSKWLLLDEFAEPFVHPTKGFAGSLFYHRPTLCTSCGKDINRENGYFGSGIFLPRPVPVQRNAIS